MNLRSAPLLTRVAAAAFAISGSLSATGDEDAVAHGKVSVSVHVAGLRIVGAGYGEDAGRISPFNWRKGTTVALMVEADSASVLDVDPASSKLDLFEDDKGTKFLPDPKSARPVMGLYPARSGDRKAALVELVSDSLADPEAKEIRIKGKLSLVVGRNKKVERTGGIAPRTGAAAVLGPRMVSVLTGVPFPDENEEAEGGGKSDAGETKGEAKNEKAGDKEGDEPEDEEGEEKVTTLSIRINGEPDNVDNVRVLGGDGKEIGAELAGVRMIRRGGVRSVYRFTLPFEYDGDIVVEADVWEERRKLQVPIDETVSVGLGQGR